MTKRDNAFTVVGFRNWKHATDRFLRHLNSDAHKEACLRYVDAPSRSYGNAPNMMSAKHTVCAENRRMLLKILGNICFLARQGLPFRGNWDNEKGVETNSNFQQLLLLRAQDDPKLLAWMNRKKQKYTSPQIQTEILQIMALGHIRTIASKIKGNPFSVMVDETADASNTEEMVICFRRVDSSLEANEDFIGIHPIPNAKADTIVPILMTLDTDISTTCSGENFEQYSETISHESMVSNSFSRDAGFNALELAVMLRFSGTREGVAI